MQKRVALDVLAVRLIMIPLDLFPARTVLVLLNHPLACFALRHRVESFDGSFAR
jgi:hypothetical protein